MGLGLTGDAAYTFVSGSPWPRIQPLGNLLVAASALVFVSYAVTAMAGLKGAHRRELAGATFSVVALLIVAAVAGPGALMEAMTSLWTLPIAILLSWWCSARVLTLQGSLVSAEAGWRAAESAVHYRARHDVLTGLLNRDGAVDTLQALIDAARPRTQVVLTEFRVSDREEFRAAGGSHSADLVLCAIARQLVDTLPPDAHVARVGETTFTAMTLLPDDAEVTGLEQEAQQVVGLLLQATDLPRDLEVSVGITTSHRTDTAVALLEEAAIAAIAAEHLRSRVQLYRPELREQIIHRARVARLLSMAVERDELQLHYQPVFDTTSLSRVGVEALVRWRHHGRLHPPAEWIPIAEQQGLLPGIGLHVLRLASREHAAAGCPIAVNVSASQLAEPDFARNVLDVLSDLPRHAIVLEITESTVMADLELARTALTTLRDHGIRIAIDDFGTEYSSLSRLATLPFDILKIDRSFVAEVVSPHGRAIVAAIHALARSLGKTTIAEGVETHEQLRILAEIGCDRVQGFLTGRPVPLAELAALAASAAIDPPPSPDAPRRQAGLRAATGDPQ